jgi:D-arabinose 5-phosphate isomerase GutQ
MCKRIIVIMLMLVVFGVMQADAQQLNYQAIARNANGVALTFRDVGIRLSIRDGSPNGSIVYSESRNIRTNQFGLFTVIIGSPGASNVLGSMASINWISGNKYLQVEIDPEGGTNYFQAGTSQLQAVPYALFANAAYPVGPAGGDLLGSTYPNPIIAPLAVTTGKIANQAITTPKIADLNVTTPKLADQAVTNAKIQDNTIANIKLVNSRVTLNGLILNLGDAQDFAIGTNGIDVNIISAGNTHTFNFPDASIANRGLITPNAQTIGGNKTFNNDITAARIIRAGGLAAQFLKADGSVDNNIYLTENQPIIVNATGDATGVSTSSRTAPVLPLTLATVNSAVGTYGTNIVVPSITVNNKGLVTNVIANPIPTATAITSGLLTVGDWNIFNNKQNAIPLGSAAQYFRGDLTLSNFQTDVRNQLSAGTNITYVNGNIGLTNNSVTLNTLPLTLGGSQTFATGTTGVDFNISSAGSVHTFNIPTASVFARGLINSTDYTNFNAAYNNRIASLTTAGTSGAATLSGNVLNIPNYTIAGLGGENAIVPGTTLQYWRGDKTWQTLNSSVVPEGTNFYYTDTRSRNALSITTSGSNGAATYNSALGVFNIPAYTLNGLGGVPSSRLINGLDLSADRTFSTSDIAEGSRQYFTSTRARTSISLTTVGTGGLSTYDNTTGVLNIPNYTVTGLGAEPSIIAGNTLQYWRGDKTWQTLNTTIVPEGTNEYFTQAKARSAISITTTGTSGSAVYSPATGVLNVPSYTLSGLGGETAITPGSILEYWRGDKTWQTLNSDATTEGTSNLFFTNTRARTALSLTTLGSNGNATFDNTTGIFNIPNYTLGGLGGEAAISAGTTAQYWRGDKTWQTLNSDVTTEGTTNIYFSNARARSALSLSVSGSSGASNYNNTTGVLTIPNYTLAGLGGEASITAGTTGQYWRGDKTWQTLNSDVTTEGSTNLYFTNTRAQNAITLTTNNNSGVATYASGTLNIPNYTIAGLGGEAAITAGTNTQYWRGDKTWQTLNSDVTTEGTTNLYFSNARARTALSLSVTGNSGASNYNNTTGILTIPNYTLAGLGGEASITPGTTGQYWRGDKTWQTLNSDVTTEGSTNLYFTNTRAQNAITLTTNNNSGVATYTGGTLNIPNYTIAGLGGETAITAGTTAQYWRGDKTWQTLNSDATTEGTTNIYFSNARARSALSLSVTGTSGASNYNNTTGVLTIPNYTLAGLGGESSITAGTTAQYWRGDKTWQTLNSDVTTEGSTNLYFTNTRAQNAITLTTNNNSGVATYASGTLNIPNYTIAGLGGEAAITAGTNTQYWRGDKTWQTLNSDVTTEGSTNLYFTNSRARTALSLSVTGSSGASNYNNATGVLTIPNYTLAGLGGEASITTGTTGQYWRGDKTWQTLNSDVTTEGSSNLYFTNTRAQNAITLTTNNNSGLATYSSGTLNIPNYTIGGLGGEASITAGTTAQYWRGDKTWQTLNSDVTTEGTTNLYFSNARARSALSLSVSGSSGASNYNNTTGVLTIPNYTLAGLGGEASITAGTTGQYWRGDKTWQTLNSDATTEGSSNLYFTNTRAQNAITLTTNNNSGLATYSSGTLNIPNYTLAGLGGESAIAGGTTAQYWRGDKTWQTLNSDVTTEGTTNLYFSNARARTALSLSVNGSSGASNYNNSTGVLNIPTYTFNGLSPMTTSGDIIYGAASGAGTRLPIGTSGQVLTVSGGLIPIWASYSGWKVDGNTGLNPADDNFLGTTDNIPLKFKVENTNSGIITTTTGGKLNTSFGLGTSIFSNTGAQNNSAFGAGSLFSITTGKDNTSIGQGTLSSNQAGDNNTAVGQGALNVNLGTSNTAVGQAAIRLHTAGNRNTAIGRAAIESVTDGEDATVLGYIAGRNYGNTFIDGNVVTTLSQSVFIGSNSRAFANISTNEIVIGYNAVGNGNNTMQLGNTSITKVNTSGSMNATKFVGKNGTLSTTLTSIDASTTGVTFSGNDAAGTISFTTTSAISVGNFITITFGTPFENTPVVLINAIEIGSSTANTRLMTEMFCLHSETTTNLFKITSNSALTPGRTYNISYHVIGR